MSWRGWLLWLLAHTLSHIELNTEESIRYKVVDMNKQIRDTPKNARISLKSSMLEHPPYTPLPILPRGFCHVKWGNCRLRLLKSITRWSVVRIFHDCFLLFVFSSNSGKTWKIFSVIKIFPIGFCTHINLKQITWFSAMKNEIFPSGLGINT